LQFSQVERIEAPSVASFRERFERLRRPIIITGAMHAWQAVSRWTPEYLVARHGDARVQVRSSELDAPQLFAGDPQKAFARREVAFATAVREAESTHPAARQYLQHCAIARELPELLPDLERPPYCPRWFVSPAFLWLAGPGTVNPLHYDLNHVLMAQIKGCKRYVLFAPRDSRWISRRLERTLWRTTSLDAGRPDEASWPELHRTRPYECILAPSEMLFIPYRFWHYAAVDDFNISVSHWWEPDAKTRLSDLLLHRALGAVKFVVRSRARG
jgi:lysine-specific demethylase 8